MKLTSAQRKLLTEIANRRCIADNDEGWVNASYDNRATRAALVRMRLAENRHPGPISAGHQMQRITPAGRAALREDSNG